MTQEKSTRTSEYRTGILTMILTGTGCGIVCGGACVIFAWLTSLCDTAFHAHDRLLWLLPAAGVLVVLLYDGLRREDELSMNALYLRMRGGKPVSPWLMPLVALSTCLAYLFGGSVGRVGSALQIGGGLAVCLGDRVNAKLGERADAKLEERVGRDSAEGNLADGNLTDKSGAAPLLSADLLLSCGIAAGFTAILNAPLAGAAFGVEVLVLRGRKLWNVIPALIASLITCGLGQLAQVPYISFENDMTGGLAEAGSLSDKAAMASLVTTGLHPGVLIRVILIGFAAMLIGRLYCAARKYITAGFRTIQLGKGPGEDTWKVLLGSRVLQVLIGTGLVILVTLLIGHTDCNGIGFVYVDRVLDGRGALLAFLWKLILTCLTLGCGIRGGEIAPTIFIGATGCFTVGCLIGLDPTLAAALGIVGALASVTNCPIAIGIYGLEAICCTPEMLLYIVIVCLISYFFSGTGGIYSEQHPRKVSFAFTCIPYHGNHKDRH